MKQPDKRLNRFGTSLNHWLRQERRLRLTAASVAVIVTLLRLAGALQPLELMMFDQLIRLRPLEPVDKRILIVAITDQDISRMGAWPLSDGGMAALLRRISAAHPRAIGLNIYRNLPVGTGQTELRQVFQTTPNLIGIEKLADAERESIPPPPLLAAQNQVGFNNVVIDSDNQVRRAILFISRGHQLHRSFALTLALEYLSAKRISLRSQGERVQLGRATLMPLHPNAGGYIGADVGGYQILANPRNPAASFEHVSLTDVMAGRVRPEQIRDRIVLIGSTATSLRDFFYTSYSSNGGNADPISGVELHAQIVSQLLNAALDGRSLIQAPPTAWKWLWVFGWSWVGAVLSWKIRPPERSALCVLLAAAGLIGVCYLALLAGWWVPLVPPLLALMGSAVIITGHLAQLEDELKKSKEFLSSILNTIPDPVFVKDQRHRWIVLNEAYCQFVGYAREMLLEKTDHDIFPLKQAAHFWHQDEQAFISGVVLESEDEFTDARGFTHAIATKRSLHKDAAGNIFLVGVIRDITQRKQIEDELRRTAAELVRSNAELRQAKTDLTRLAYHDPLTDLPNRQLFQTNLTQALEWAERQNQLMALLFLDLDGFKRINDTHGHQAGDLLLRVVAQRLVGCLRSSDTVSRLGGDEFVVLVSGVLEMQDVIKVAEKILAKLAEHYVLAGTTMSISASIGISIYPIDSDSPEELLLQADAAMYQAKESGKNRYALFRDCLSAGCLEAIATPHPLSDSDAQHPGTDTPE
jgi:diguanylate cyclase (GGDEF)-like protein/PAS domain S-box-containing protein